MLGTAKKVSIVLIHAMLQWQEMRYLVHALVQPNSDPWDPHDLGTRRNCLLGYLLSV